MSSTVGARLPLTHRVLGRVYRLAPPLKYWGLRKAYLKRTGWVRSGWANAPVDAHGGPLPWYTYPCIAFLEGRVRPEMRVFEYGSGQSTRWWAARVQHVDSVEDDKTWFERVSTDIPGNVDLRFASSDGDAYERSALDRGKRFDVVVIDGSHRDECAHATLEVIDDRGVVIWDNTQKPGVFSEGLGTLEAAGFRRVDFFGIGPLNMDPWCTTVLYRPGANCFNL